jgi:hypothetical protein
MIPTAFVDLGNSSPSTCAIHFVYPTGSARRARRSVCGWPVTRAGERRYHPPYYGVDRRIMMACWERASRRTDPLPEEPGRCRLDRHGRPARHAAPWTWRCTTAWPGNGVYPFTSCWDCHSRSHGHFFYHCHRYPQEMARLGQ